MTTICLALLALASLTATGQKDTAEAIVDRYVELLGYTRLPQDSMLTMVTTVTSPGTADTFVMKRWFVPPLMMRVEVWHGDTLTNAFCTNGKSRYRIYDRKKELWTAYDDYIFYEKIVPYDFRGPLYNWRAQGLTLSYKGITKAKGDHELQTVTVEGPGYYTRHYMFEPSGLLAVIIETDEIDTVEYRRYEDGHIDWKIEHEYMEVAPGVLLPKEESFMRLGVLTVLRTEAWLEPRQTLLFNKDK